ncbi:FecR family protein [Arcobacteraceae bacterium]|nr:FecR family protein [Arcobacteraceae bacterium]
MKKYLLLLILPILSFANIGHVTVLQGEASITRGISEITVSIGRIINKNDFITTSTNSKLQIVFNDNTIFTIGQNSTLKIADFLYDENKPIANKVQLNVLKGVFTSITGRIGQLNKSKFKLKTKSASIGIRGTTVSANQDTIICTDGSVKVTTNNGVSVNVDAGYKTNVSSGTPTKPIPITQGDIEALDASIKQEKPKETDDSLSGFKVTPSKYIISFDKDSK